MASRGRPPSPVPLPSKPGSFPNSSTVGRTATPSPPPRPPSPAVIPLTGSFSRRADPPPPSVGAVRQRAPQPRHVGFAPLEVQRDKPPKPPVEIQQSTATTNQLQSAAGRAPPPPPPRPSAATLPLATAPSLAPCLRPSQRPPPREPKGAVAPTGPDGSTYSSTALEVIGMLDRVWAKSNAHGPAQNGFTWNPTELRNLLEVIGPLCKAAKKVLKSQDYPMLQVKSPVVVLGDLHGRFDDLQFFLTELYDPRRLAPSGQAPPHGDHRIADNVLLLSDKTDAEVANIWDVPEATDDEQPSRRAVSEFFYPGRRSMLCGSLLFLGDYVDRGFASLEVALYVLALKVLDPHKVNVLRGNHEKDDVNDEYGFKAQCEALFGPTQGMHVWQCVNGVFDDFPLAAVLDGKIFCAHGGIPRLGPNGAEDRLDILRRTGLWKEFRDSPSQAVILEEPRMTRVSEIFDDLLWSDPAEEDMEEELDAYGFGPSIRGVSVTYSAKAVNTFLSRNGFTRIMRAHQMKPCGFSVSQNGKVVTVFSSSHYGSPDEDNFAGVAYVTPESIRAITRC